MKNIDSLVDDYIETVLLHLFPNVSRENMWFKESGLMKNELRLKLSTQSILESNKIYRPNITSFVHFTSLRAFHSILNEQCIRMYNLNNVNDPNEISFSLNELAYSEKEIQKMKEKIYCLSMCSSDVFESDNILNLWRLYGNNGWGVAIEFNIERTETLTDFVLANVIYEKIDFTSFLKANADFENRNNVVVKHDDLLQIPASIYKNPYYKIENEIRLLFDGKSYPASETLEEYCRYKHDYNSRFEKVGYFSLPLFEKRSDTSFPSVSIKKIQLGFQFQQEQFEVIRKHASDLMLATMKRLHELKKFERPLDYVIEQSPLMNVYR